MTTKWHNDEEDIFWNCTQDGDDIFGDDGICGDDEEVGDWGGPTSEQGPPCAGGSSGASVPRAAGPAEDPMIDAQAPYGECARLMFTNSATMYRTPDVAHTSLNQTSTPRVREPRPASARLCLYHSLVVFRAVLLIALRANVL